jgi:hypothetical protein
MILVIATDSTTGGGSVAADVIIIISITIIIIIALLLIFFIRFVATDPGGGPVDADFMAALRAQEGGIKEASGVKLK